MEFFNIVRRYDIKLIGRLPEQQMLQASIGEKLAKRLHLQMEPASCGRLSLIPASAFNPD
jgi:hypothetical protein